MSTRTADRYTTVFKVAVGLTIFDSIATAVVMSLGATELNPVLTAQAEVVGTGGMLLLRVVLGVVMLTVLWRLAQRSSKIGFALILVTYVLIAVGAYHVLNTTLWWLIN